jgi:excisionase family DNA binding protein
MEVAKLLWSVKEVGTALGLSQWTIRRYVTDRRLAAVRLGRRVLIEPSECRRLIEEGRAAPSAEDSEGSKPTQRARPQTTEPVHIGV